MLHWLYPETCQLCGGECRGATLCDSCRAALPRMPRPICLYCGASVSGAQSDPYHCDDCNGRERSFDFARAALAEGEDAIRLIHDLKYHGAVHLASALAPLLDEVWHHTPQLQQHHDWLLVPVPITPVKLRTRGYNQAWELAHALAVLRGNLRVAEPLERRETGIVSQTRLSREQRRANAKAAYRLRAAYARGKRPLPPRLLLIDDVYTTGSTARACAAALKQVPGVESVGVLTLLHIC